MGVPTHIANNSTGQCARKDTTLGIVEKVVKWGRGGRGAQLCGTLDSRLRVQGQKLERTLKSAKRNQHLQVNLYPNDQCSVVALFHTGANSGEENK